VEVKPVGAIEIRIASGDLERLLDMPGGVRIVRLHVDYTNGDDSLRVIAVGYGLPVPSEGEVPDQKPVAFEEQYVAEYDENRLFINWGATCALETKP
jgi:hypothetical protein